MANPVGYQGRGTLIAFAPTSGGVVSGAYTNMTQLEKFSKSGVKTEFDDITCLDSPGVNKFPFPVQFDNGKWDGAGVFNPQDSSQQVMMQNAQGLVLLGYKVTLIDGSTYVGLCYIDGFQSPSEVDVKKALRYTFSVMVFGVETFTPLGGSGISE
jgi:hypothetical protein